jgi:hypothetical protein
MKIGVINADGKVVVFKHGCYIAQAERKPVAFESAEPLKGRLY